VPEPAEPRWREPTVVQRGRSRQQVPADPGAAGRTGPTLSQGETLAGRFRIVRFIAEGGMGEVYEAEDLELHDRVALKTVLPELAQHPQVMQRFNREIQLARKVTHPNVCRIYDLFHHVREFPKGSGRRQTITFLSMEFLPGETLAERVMRAGRMSMAESLPIIEQMAAALGAAHEAGIVHRDFKSPNVMLVQGKKGLRAVVTDFGLAQAPEGESHGTVTVHQGGLTGTPAYMAPEQVENLPTSPATDLYSLGIVIYEMVTGTRPFQGGSDMAIAAKRILEAPVPPRQHVPELDPRWDATILACLQRQPADRPQTAVAVVQGLGGGDLSRLAAGTSSLPPGVTSLPPAVAPAAPARLSWRGTALAALFFLVTGGAFATLLYVKRPDDAREVGGANTGAALPPAKGSDKARRSLAVLGFKNLSGRPETAWLSTALSEMLGTELGAGDQLRIIPGENVARMKLELAVRESESLAADTLTKVRGNLGCDYVVLGAYLAVGQRGSGELRLDLRVQDTARGETVAQVAETGKDGQLLDLVARAGVRLRQVLGVGTVDAREAVTARAQLMKNAEATRLYSEGLTRLRQFDARAAQVLFARAAQIEPDHPVIHSALASAWDALGYDAKAAEAATRAHQLAAGLPRAERLAVEGRYHESQKAWERAIDVYRALYQFYPDNLEYGLRLLSAQVSAGRPAEAESTLAALRTSSLEAASDPRLDLQEASLAALVSNFERQRQAGKNAAAKGERRGTRLLLARGLLEEGRALHRLARWEEADTRLEAARQLFEAAGDRGALALVLNNLANTASARGDQQRAQGLYEKSLAARREIGDQSGVEASLNNLGLVLTFQGKLHEAQKRLEEALTLRSGMRDKGTAAYVLNSLGTVLLELDRIDEAGPRFEEAAAFNRRVGNRYSLSYSLHGLGRVAQLRGQLADAEKMHTDALELRVATGGRARAPESQLALAEVLLAEGKRPLALAMADRAIRESMAERAPQFEAMAHAFKALLLVPAAGRGPRAPAEALAQLTQADTLASRTEFAEARMYVERLGVEVLRRLGRRAEAATRVQAALALPLGREMALQRRLMNSPTALARRPPRAR
jgi:tetratricopeptide (TPR) repeat protein/TolB-like protein